MKILLCVTGSVAAKLTSKLVQAFLDAQHEVMVATTEKALYFWKLSDLPKNVAVYQDKDEWGGIIELCGPHYTPGDPVLHINLRNWADVAVIAPLSANTLAKIANGLADNLVTSIMRAWDQKKPVVLAPAMNTLMWYHPLTQKHLTSIDWTVKPPVLVGPVSKMLACKEEGVGAMASIESIVEAVNSLAGEIRG